MAQGKKSAPPVDADADVPAGRGVVCLEGDWDERLADRLSVEPLLRMLVDAGYATNYVHRDVATRGDLSHHLQRWLARSADDYPLLYLAFHGSRRKLHLADDTEVSLDELGQELEGLLAGRVLYFGSCKTVDISDAELRALCLATRAKAVVGYTTNVDWLDSVALDLIVLARLLWSHRMDHAYHQLRKAHPVLVESLGLRIVTPHWASPSKT